MKFIIFISAIMLLVTGCNSVKRIGKEDALMLVQNRPEVQSFLRVSKDSGDKTDIIAEEHEGLWEVGVYTVLPDHMSTFNFYKLDQNGHLMSFRDKYDDKGNFVCSTTTDPQSCK